MLPLPHESVELDGVKFTTTKFPAVQGFTLLTRLTKAIGGALVVLSRLDPNSELAPGVLIEALGALDPAEVEALLPKVLAGTSALVEDGGKSRQVHLNSTTNIDSVFNGREMSVMFKVIGHALKTNYGNFSLGTAAETATAAAAA